MPPALVAGATAAASLYSAYKGGKGVDQQKSLIEGQRGLIDEQTRTAREIRERAGKTFDFSMPSYMKAMDYYKSGLTGNRGVLGQLVGTELGMQNELYKGSAKNLEFRGARGGDLEQGQQDLNKQKVFQQGNMIAGLRPQMASSLLSGATQGMGLGSQMYSGVSPNYGNAGIGYSGLINAEQNAQNSKNSLWEKAGGSIMNMLLPYLMNQSGKKAPLTSTPYGSRTGSVYGLPGGNSPGVNWGSQVPYSGYGAGGGY
jgi:hypothetical protein